MRYRLGTEWPQLVPVLLLAVICAVLLGLGDHLSHDRIKANRRATQLYLIDAVMPQPHDNDLLADSVQISDSSVFGTGSAITVYRARIDNRPAGLVFMPIPAHGYNGTIELAVGLAYGGEVTGVRVLAHRETPGLGDQIHQDHSGWILGFDGRSLQDTPVGDWGLRGDGGAFDQISGASISPRGVIRAVKDTLDYYALHRDELYH
jgi:electron transport complex protein RnfG